MTVHSSYVVESEFFRYLHGDRVNTYKTPSITGVYMYLIQN